jgi:hypothetical protein
VCALLVYNDCLFLSSGKGGKNVKRGKNGNAEETRRALQYKEDGQGKLLFFLSWAYVI